MSYDAAYLAADMIERGTPEGVYCELEQTAKGWMIWLVDEYGHIVECCMTVGYAMHLFHGKAMI